MDCDIKNICIGVPFYKNENDECDINKYINNRKQDMFIPIYKYSDGETKYFIQESTNHQIQIKQFNSNVNASDIYPFEIEHHQQISKIRIKCNNTKLYFTNDYFTSSNYILIEIKNDIINIWNYDEVECNILQTNGNSICDGYMINDFENKKIKVTKRFLFREWKYGNINASDIEIYGNDNDVTFANNFIAKNFSILSYGSETNIIIPKYHYDNVKINLFDSSHIKFNGSIIESLSGESRGISSISNVSVRCIINHKILGLSKIDLNKT
jgi:hypothetical protein